MSKYVPRFLQGAKVTPQESAAPVTQEQKAAPVSRWMPLVNTSVPAKEAPVLPSATLASLTKKEMPAASLQPVTGASLKSAKALPKEEDFPTLGKPAVVKVTTPASKPTFSELSKQWAIKKKEEEEKADELAKLEADTKRAELARRQKEESHISSIKIITLPSAKKQSDDEDGPRTVRSDSDEVDPFDDGMDEQEEEEEQETDDGWGYRKHRNELY